MGRRRKESREQLLWYKDLAQKKEMSHFEIFVTEGNEKVDEVAKAGAILDEEFLAEARAKTVQHEREEVYAALQYAASFHCFVEESKECGELKPKPKEKWIFVDSKREETKHRTEWCAEASRYRWMRCGEKQQTHEDARKMHRTNKFVKIVWKMGESVTLDGQGEVVFLV